jgi:glutamate dehydrogenase
VEYLDNQVAPAIQLEMLSAGRRLVERATRWLARANPQGIDIAATIRSFEPGARMLAGALPELLEGTDRDAFDDRGAKLRAVGVPAELARRVAGMPSWLRVFDIVEVAELTKRKPDHVMKIYFRLGSRLELDWLHDRIIELPRSNRWQALARAALRDDLDNLHRLLTNEVLEASGPTADSETAIESWAQHNSGALARCRAMVADVRASRVYDTTTLPVALREVRNLIRASGSVEGIVGAESVTLAGETG